MIIQARLEQTKTASRRASPRRKISLQSSLHATGEPVAIHDLSPTGMLIETAAKLPLLGGIEIDLPEAGNTNAVVVWNSGRYYGCEFRAPLPKAVVSAALLRSRPTPHAPPAQPSQLGPSAAVRADVVGTAPLQVDEAISAPQAEQSAELYEDEKASLTVRLRVILGSAILLWALIIWAVRSASKMIG